MDEPEEQSVHNENAKVAELRNMYHDGLLPSLAWPGFYPLFYFDAENNVLCADCANKNDEFSAPLVEYDVNWEDPTLYCDHCSKRIESAYAEDEEEKGDVL